MYVPLSLSIFFLFFLVFLLLLILLLVLLNQYTINSKKVEVAVKRIISGDDIKQRGALANPNSLDLYYNIPELSLPNKN